MAAILSHHHHRDLKEKQLLILNTVQYYRVQLTPDSSPKWSLRLLLFILIINTKYC